jgi:hypothetical protein
MKASIRLVICLIAACSLRQSTSFGCSLVIPPVSRFDAEQYVFIGEVVDVVGPFKSEDNKAEGEAWGLRVKVSGKVYLPTSPANYFEVFPYHLTPSCGLAGRSKEELLKYYPVGSQIRVIAKESTLLGSKLSEGDVRLEVSVYNRGSVVRNAEPSLTTAEAVYDYGKYVEQKWDSEGNRSGFESNYYLPDFELRKDLLRLEEATSESEKISVLERLLSFPHVYPIDYSEIAASYVKDAETLKRLEQKWKAWQQKTVEQQRN